MRLSVKRVTDKFVKMGKIWMKTSLQNSETKNTVY